MSTEWSAKSEVQRESAERQVQGECRKASADRQPTTHPNTLGGYDHVRIQVAKQVRTVPVRGCDAEKVLVLRSVISETVLPPTPTPHPDTSENVEKQQKTITTTCKNCPKMTSNDPRGRSKRPRGPSGEIQKAWLRKI